MNLKIRNIIIILAIFIGIAALGFISNQINCNDQVLFIESLKYESVFTSRGSLRVEGTGKGKSYSFICFKHGKKDTTNFIIGCGFKSLFSEKYPQITFVLYTDKSETVLPVTTRTRWKLLNQYYPDSAKLMDTAELIDD